MTVSPIPLPTGRTCRTTNSAVPAVEEPLTIVWDLTPPGEDDVVITVKTDQRRGAVLQRLTGLDGELRRFIIKFIARELDKPHVRKATRIHVVDVIRPAWPQLAAQFLPNSSEDRREHPETQQAPGGPGA